MLQIWLYRTIIVNSGNLLKKFFFLLAICCAACGRDKEKIINDKVAERVNTFRSKKNVECRDALVAEAEKIVDSLLLAEAKMELGDSLTRLRPARPIKPSPIPPIDSLLVKPIFAPDSSTRNKR